MYICNINSPISDYVSGEEHETFRHCFVYAVTNFKFRNLFVYSIQRIPLIVCPVNLNSIPDLFISKLNAANDKIKLANNQSFQIFWNSWHENNCEENTRFVYAYVVVKASHPLMLITYYLILYYQERLF
jgi:hypothetical protein